ncbi:4-(cytidine 5'-diphospho)-2-C-methyl-D-erythritol kinase [Candidatus Sumerlaeota bacterium]|nr:4-(cytidine 5'-diphospho)-2-C-methyl-D-erythritol kinase [Candidatus Sumerlaeota bacterium]
MTPAQAPAKINLFLDILSRRADGFHNIHTAFCSVTLFDELRVCAAGQRADSATLPIRSFVVTGPFAEGIPTDGRNIVWQAITRAIASLRQQHCRFWDRYYPRFDIELVKNIPHGAGLGGGSSDAATALKLFDDAVHAAASHAGYGDLRMEPREIFNIATSLGSDVPYFLSGGFSEATGRGERLSPIPSRELSLLILKPDFSISTREAYAAATLTLSPRSDFAQLKKWLAGEATDFPELYNSFEPALDSQYPELRRMRMALKREGAFFTRLSGSGSATFGLFADDASRDRAHDVLRDAYQCFPCNAITER